MERQQGKEQTMPTFMEFDFAGVWDDVCYDDAGIFVPEPQVVVRRILKNLEGDVDTIANAVNRNMFCEKDLQIATEYVKNVREKIVFLKSFFDSEKNVHLRWVNGKWVRED